MPVAVRSGGPPARPQQRRSSARRVTVPVTEAGLPPFHAILDRAPYRSGGEPRPLPAARIVSAGSSSDGAHLARVETADGTDRELLVSVLVDRGRVRVHVEAAALASMRWVQERTGRIREALEEVGLELESLELGRGRDGRGERGRRRRG